MVSAMDEGWGISDQRARTTVRLSWLDTVPEPGPQQGEFRMLGRGGDEARVQVATNAAPAFADLGGWLDQGGDGRREVVLTGTWLGAGIASGVLFADYTRMGKGGAYAYNPQEFTIRPAFVGSSVLPTDATFTLQFTVRPVKALLYSRRYELRVDTGEPSENGQLMRATTGGTLSVFAGSIGRFTTPDFLNPQSTLAGRPTLKAGTPLEVSAFPLPAGTNVNVRYQWAQVSGTPITISQAGGRVAVIALGAGARGIGSSTVRLSVQLDGTDQTESADFVLRTVADTSDPWFSRLRAPMGLQDAFTPPEELWSGPAVGSLSASQEADRLTLSYVEAPIRRIPTATGASNCAAPMARRCDPEPMPTPTAPGGTKDHLGYRRWTS